MNLRKFLTLGNSILGAATALTPFVLFPVCAEPKPDGTPMNCWYSGVLITVMGVLIAGFSLMSLRGKLQALFTSLTAAAALMCWLVPNGIIRLAGDGWECGLCADPGHACRAVTVPALGILAAAVVLLSVLALVLQLVQPPTDRMRGR